MKKVWVVTNHLTGDSYAYHNKEFAQRNIMEVILAISDDGDKWDIEMDGGIYQFAKMPIGNLMIFI